MQGLKPKSQSWGALKSVLNQVALTNLMVAQSHSQGQAVQGRVVGMESGMAEVLAQVGRLGCEVHEHRAAAASFPPVKITLRVDPRCVVPDSEARGTSQPYLPQKVPPRLGHSCITSYQGQP